MAELEAELAKVVSLDLNAYSKKDDGAKHFDPMTVAHEFARGLIYIFVIAVGQQLKARFEEEAKKAGKKVADEIADLLTKALGRKVKDLRKVVKDEIRDSKDDLAKMRSYLGNPDARRLVLSAGRDAIAKQLEETGFPPKIAAKRADELVKIIEVRELAPA